MDLHQEAVKHAGLFLMESFLQLRKFNFAFKWVLLQMEVLFRIKSCWKWVLLKLKRDTYGYSGSTIGAKFVVSNAFDCIKHCITDSSCQAYQIGYIHLHEFNCHLFSEAIVESPSIPTNLGFKRTIGIKPQRLSSHFLDA